MIPNLASPLELIAPDDAIAGLSILLAMFVVAALLAGGCFKLALELARKGITVNAIAPGFIETEMIAAMPDEVRAKILEKIPMGRFGRPEEIAQAVAFLVSGGDYITGQVISIDGGLYT